MEIIKFIKYTNAEVISNLQNKFGDMYNYDSVNYTSAFVPIKLKCKIHGLFNLEYRKLKNFKGCNLCYLENQKKLHKEAFIKNIKEKFGDLYNYNNVEYNGTQELCKIECNIHGFFQKKAYAVSVNGRGCPECKSELDSKNLEYKEKIYLKKCKNKYGNTIDYSLIKFKSVDHRIEFKCNICNNVQSKVAGKLLVSGCGYCGRRACKDSLEDFINKANKTHYNKYDYSLSDYVTSNVKIKIICKKCSKLFEQLPSNHIAGKGCSDCCIKQKSKKSDIWLTSLNNKNIIPEYRIPENYKKPVDGYDATTNTIYEFLGKYWHGDLRVHNRDDIDKRRNMTYGEIYDKTIKMLEDIKSYGYNLVIMWEYDWQQLNKTLKKAIK